KHAEHIAVLTHVHGTRTESHGDPSGVANLSAEEPYALMRARTGLREPWRATARATRPDARKATVRRVGRSDRCAQRPIEPAAADGVSTSGPPHATAVSCSCRSGVLSCQAPICWNSVHQLLKFAAPKLVLPVLRQRLVPNQTPNHVAGAVVYLIPSPIAMQFSRGIR